MKYTHWREGTQPQREWDRPTTRRGEETTTGEPVLGGGREGGKPYEGANGGPTQWEGVHLRH